MSAKVAEAKVSDALVEEINSIKMDDGRVDYEPKAWNREGRTD